MRIVCDGNEIECFPTESQIEQARSWIFDNDWIEDEDVLAGLSDWKIVEGVHHFFSGGWEAFVACCVGE